MSYQRQLLSTLRTLLSHPTAVIHALIGPRQVGKTTIVRQIQDTIGFPSIYATADSPVPLDSVWIETLKMNWVNHSTGPDVRGGYAH